MGQCCTTLNGYIYSQYDGYDPIPGQDTSPLPYSSSSSSSSTSTHSVAGGSAVLLADVIAEDVALSIQANLDDIGLSEQVSVADLVALPAVLRGPSTEALSALTTRDLSPLGLSPAQADAVFTAVQRSTGGRVRPDKGKKGKSPGPTRNRRRRRRRRHKSRGCCAMTPGSMAWQPPPFGQIADNRPHRTLFQELEEHGVQASELEREQLTPELLSTVLTSVYDLVYMEPGDLNDSPLTPAQRTALLRVATALRTKLHRKFAAAAGGGGGGGGGGGRASGTSAGTGKTASRPPNAAAKSEAAVEKGEGSESGTDNGQHGKKHSDECGSATTTTTTDEKPGRSEEAAHLALAEARRTAREPLRRIFATIARVESDFLQGRDLQAIMSAEMGRHLTFKGGGAASGSGGNSGRDSNDGTSGSTKGEEDEEDEEENDSGGDRDGNVDDGEEEEQEVPVGSSAAGAGIGGSVGEVGGGPGALDAIYAEALREIRGQIDAATRSGARQLWQSLAATEGDTVTTPFSTPPAHTGGGGGGQRISELALFAAVSEYMRLCCQWNPNRIVRFVEIAEHCRSSVLRHHPSFKAQAKARREEILRRHKEHARHSKYAIAQALARLFERTSVSALQRRRVVEAAVRVMERRARRRRKRLGSMRGRDGGDGNDGDGELKDDDGGGDDDDEDDDGSSDLDDDGSSYSSDVDGDDSSSSGNDGKKSNGEGGERSDAEATDSGKQPSSNGGSSSRAKAARRGKTLPPSAAALPLSLRLPSRATFTRYFLPAMNRLVGTESDLAIELMMPLLRNEAPPTRLEFSWVAREAAAAASMTIVGQQQQQQQHPHQHQRKRPPPVMAPATTVHSPTVAVAALESAATVVARAAGVSTDDI